MTRCGHCGQEHPAGTAVCPLTNDSLAAPGLIGQRLDRYQVEGLLGAGGFGAVYRAVHQHTDARVALKVLKPTVSSDPTIVERFLREAKAAAAVGSDHIVRVLDAGVAQPSGQAFLAMELLDGCDLRELAARAGVLPPTRLVLIVGQVLDGLGAAHAKGIVHRDMKPANVFVSRRVDDQGVERDVVRLLDFGISKMHGDGATSGLTVSGMAMGTPSYMAPEQFFDARNVDARADLYSVAVMLYELLSGRLPFEADSYAALIVKVKTEAPQPLLQLSPSVPSALAQAVMVGLAKEKEKRWATAQDFHQALRAALGLPPRPTSTAVAAPSPSAPPAARPPSADTPSMLHGKTAPPVRANVTPYGLPAPTGSVAPPPLSPGPMPAAPVPPAVGGAPSNPPFAPPGPPSNPQPFAPPPPAPPAPAPAARTSTAKVLLIVLGVIGLLTGCCVCTAIIGAAGQANEQANQQPDGPMPGGRRPPRRAVPKAPEVPAEDPPADDAPPDAVPADEAAEAAIERAAQETAQAIERAAKEAEQAAKAAQEAAEAERGKRRRRR